MLRLGQQMCRMLLEIKERCHFITANADSGVSLKFEHLFFAEEREAENM